MSLIKVTSPRIFLSLKALPPPTHAGDDFVVSRVPGRLLALVTVARRGCYDEHDVVYL